MTRDVARRRARAPCPRSRRWAAPRSARARAAAPSWRPRSLLCCALCTLFRDAHRRCSLVRCTVRRPPASGSSSRTSLRMVSQETHAAGREQRGADHHRQSGTPRRTRPGRRTRRRCSPTATGSAATASSEPARATALLTPLAMPACSSGAAASTVAVSGATISAEPEAEDDHARQHVEDVGRRPAPIRSSSSTPDRHHERPDRHRDPRADPRAPAGPPAAARSSMQMVIGSDRGAGRQRAVPAHGLQLEGHEEARRAEGAVDEQGHHVGRAEGPVAEDPERQHRLAARGARRRRSRPRPSTPTTTATQARGAAPLDQRVRRPAERGGREDRAGQVEVRRGVRVAGLGHRTSARSNTVTTASGRLIRKIQRQSAYSHQGAADERADRAGDAAEPGPGADRRRPVVVHEGALDHRQAARA